ncbi:serine/threonine protein kinase [Pirellulaceae bacterium SH449]
MSDDEIFGAALDLETEAQQQAMVESFCGSDKEQLQRIMGLLKTHHQLSSKTGIDSLSILDQQSAVFRAFSETEELLPGKQVGKYVLKKLIGEGATSLVFQAQELSPIDRDVALKILKPGMDSRRILARFSLEHEVIQRLEHAGITRVFDMGVQQNGRPFFAMELVPNPLTITDYAERFALDLRSRVELMIATCEIVQHAHQRGVIHRDLKPSNILIEGVRQSSPAPRIIDFGIAKVLHVEDGSSESITIIGDRFGTPAYMSPEQALMPANGVDIRSDVYSLGVVLFELLTGRTPRGHSGNADSQLSWTSEAYWEYEVPLPSVLRKQHMKPSRNSPPNAQLQSGRSDGTSCKAIGGSERELDLVVLKSIARDRHHRYQTVSDLQRDLQRYLSGEPIEAAGGSLVYRVKKLVYHNRALTAAIVVTLTTIVATAILTTSYAFRAHSAEQQVRQQLKKTLDTQRELMIQRDREEEAKRQSQSLLRVFQVQTATDRAFGRFLKEMIDSVQRGELEAQLSSDSISIDSQILTQPHQRLIISGDWSWASRRLSTEIVNTSFHLASREAAKALSHENHSSTKPRQHHPRRDDAPESYGKNSQESESLRGMLLDELRVILPENDPFIAEVLDNSGLHALDMKQFKDAKRFLTESVYIWRQSEKYLENLTQSQLFLAEAQLHSSEFRQAEVTLNEALMTLQRLPAGSKDAPSLRNFHDRLQAELAGKRNQQQE